MKTIAVIGLMLLISTPAGSQDATGLEDLLAADQLRIHLDVDTSAPVYQRVPLVLTVDIATRTWFSRGTRVRDFRIENAVTLPFSSFADNQSRRADGATWTVQRWRYRVIPQLAGTLRIPPLKVFVSVNDGASHSIEGEWQLDPREVRVEVPPGAPSADEPWLAARALEVRESWSGELENYLPGDAITRTRRFIATDTPAMMLFDSAPAPIEGLSFYAAPAAVRDNSNRGQITGTREERLVITFQEPGTYRLPSREYRWFNTAAQRFESLSLAGRTFEVGGEAGRPDAADEPGAPWPWLRGAAWILLTMALAAAATALARSDKGACVAACLRGLAAQRRRRVAYARAVQAADAARALVLLREHAALGGVTDLLAATRDDEGRSSALRALLSQAYGDALQCPDTSAAMDLYHAFDRAPRRPRLLVSAPTAGLTLNPEASRQDSPSAR